MKATLAAVFAASLCCSGCSSNSTDSAKIATSTSLQTQTTTSRNEVKAGSTSQLSESATPAPVALTEEQQRGEKVFRKSYCVGCHADGNNSMMPDKPIKGKAFSQKYKDDALLGETIRKGFPDEGMPAFGKDQISESQMKDLILYIRTLTPIN